MNGDTCGCVSGLRLTQIGILNLLLGFTCSYTLKFKRKETYMLSAHRDMKCANEP